MMRKLTISLIDALLCPYGQALCLMVILLA